MGQFSTICLQYIILISGTKASDTDTEVLLNSDVSKVSDVLSSLVEADESPCGTSAVDTQGTSNI
jgi:hypothetical protein